MRRLFILTLILALTSAANATVVVWSEDSITMSLNTTVVVQLVGDGPGTVDSMVGNDASSIATITNITGPGIITNSYPGWWTISYTGSSPWWDVTISAGSVTGTHNLHSDYDGGDDILGVTVIPEPTSVLLLAVGTLALLRKRRGEVN